MSAPLPVSYISLKHKPNAKLAYTFVTAKASPETSSSTTQPLLVFLTGLGLPAVFYHPVISRLSEQPVHPAFLTYDRYGQGASTDRDPLDADAEDPKHGHTVTDVVADLNVLIETISEAQGIQQNGKAPPVFFVANSIGCAIARVYAATFPNTVIGLLLLDSVVANTDFVSVYPDPDSFSADEVLPEGVTLDGLRTSRARTQMIFHPSQGSAEGLSRKNLKDLLPNADEPRLVWSDGDEGGADNLGKGPWVTVVGHGYDKFAEDGFKGMGIPVAETKAYVNPHWNTYNIGLTKITSQERSRGPIIAEKAGHFIQKDDPDFVVEEINALLKKIIGPQ